MPEFKPPTFFTDLVFPSGDVSMPWSWVYQFAPITINQMKTSNPSMERKIVTEVASYGRQLGRTIEALAVLVERMPTSKLNEEEQCALKQFGTMAREIAAVKGGYKAPTQENLQNIVSAVTYWKENDKEFYQQVKSALTDEFNRDGTQKTKNGK